MNMRSLVRHSWMMAVRGALAIAFGLAVLLWPNATLSIIVVLFGVYAFLDGAWTLAAAILASTRILDAWPVALEGTVSLALGLLALVDPFVSRDVVVIIASWGLVTGVLELVIAAGMRRSAPGHWLMATAGASSLFLAVLILVLPYAGADLIARIVAAYAQVFGVVMLLTAVDFPRRLRSAEAR